MRFVFSYRLLINILLVLFFVLHYYLGYVKIIGTLSPSNLFLLALSSTLLFTTLLKGQTRFSIVTLLAIAMSIFMVIWSLILDLPYDYSTKKYIVPLVTFVSIRYLCIKKKNIDQVLIIFGTTVVISCIVAIGQALDINFFWNLRYLIGLPESSFIYDSIKGTAWSPRVACGLAYFKTQLSYHIVSVFPFMIYLTSRPNKRTRQVGIIYSVIIIVASLSIHSISSSISCIVIAASFWLRYYYKPNLTHIFSIIGILGVITVGLILTGLQTRILTLDGSALSRIVFLLMGVKILIEHPFGASINQIEAAKYTFISDPIISNLRAFDWIFDTSFHNSVLNFSLVYGFLGLLFYLFIIIYFINHFKKLSNRSNDVSGQMFYYLGYIFIFGYCIQMLTHNGGMLTGDMYFWITLGVFTAFPLASPSNAPQPALGSIKSR